jgi:hypothetical protein
LPVPLQPEHIFVSIVTLFPLQTAHINPPLPLHDLHFIFPVPLQDEQALFSQFEAGPNGICPVPLQVVQAIEPFP